MASRYHSPYGMPAFQQDNSFLMYEGSVYPPTFQPGHSRVRPTSRRSSSSCRNPVSPPFYCVPQVRSVHRSLPTHGVPIHPIHDVPIHPVYGVPYPPPPQIFNDHDHYDKHFMHAPPISLMDIIKNLIMNDRITDLFNIVELWDPPYQYKTKIEILMHNARCCKHWGEFLKKFGLKKASFKLLDSALEQFARRCQKSHKSLVGSKMSALFESMTIALEIGVTNKVPFENFKNKDICHSIHTFLPCLQKDSQRKKLMMFAFIKDSCIPKSGYLCDFLLSTDMITLSWMQNHKVCTKPLCEQLLNKNGLKIDVKETTVVKTFHDEICSLVLSHSSNHSKSIYEMIDYSIRKKMPQTACVFLQRNPDENALKKAYQKFDVEDFKIFNCHCNPLLRRHLLQIILFQPDQESNKRSSAIKTIISSGEIDSTSPVHFKLKELLQNNNSLSMLLTHPIVLEKLFTLGVTINVSNAEIINILLDQKKNITAVVNILLILLKNGVNVNILEHACRSKNHRNAVMGALELERQSGDKRIVEVALQMTPGRYIEEAKILIDSYDPQTNSKSRRRKRKSHRGKKETSPLVQESHQSLHSEATTVQDESKKIEDQPAAKEKKEENNELFENINLTLNRLLVQPSEYFQTDYSEVTKPDNENEESDHNDQNETILPASANEDMPTLLDASAKNGDADLLKTVEQDEEWVCDIFSQLPWTIVISKQAADFLKAKKTSKKVIKNIKQKLHSLAKGHRDKALCHRNIQPEDNLYETYLTRESRIIWQETIQYSEQLSTKESKVYTDVIRVLWIATRHTTTQLNDVLQKIKAALKKSRNSQIKKSLTLVPTAKEPSSFFKKPRIFTEQKSASTQIDDVYHPIPNLFEGEYSMMQFHSFPEFLDAFLKSDITNYDTPICMSPQEHDVIHLPYKGEPIVLCGRSGTGKTTTCIYRMWNEYRTFWERYSAMLESPRVELKEANLCEGEETNDEDENEEKEYLNQIFVTKSPVLCSQVQKHFEKLVNGNLKLKKLRVKPSSKEKSLKNFPSESYPLFLTSRQFLILLDNSLPGKPFLRRNEEGDLLIHLCNADYNQDSNPDKLFDDTPNNEDDNNDPKQGKEQDWIEVTADFFCQKIWPRLQKGNSVHSKINLDPLLVWIEIQSFIKGSMNALKSDKGHLPRDHYVNEIGKKMAPSFTTTDRNKVYDYFEEYNELLHKRAKDFNCDCLFDECDIVYNLFKRIPLQHNNPSWHISHFYIDEVQDFTQAELTLLLKCSHNPNGTFCTGDTAQSIMKGVFFRFDDLRSQFWELAQSGLTAGQYKPTAVVPKLHHLTDNFRAHSGILNLAQSIINIMKQKFPKSFQDALLHIEVAMFEGPQPILLDAKSTDELTAVLLGNARDSKGIHHELGAHQAILVRSEEAKDSLPESLRDGIVLTVLEAKGLEFNDVLLYNFFKDSTATKEWRLFENLCDESEELNSLLKYSPRGLPVDDEDSLKSLLAELKYLYTAITRAKVNLWVYDSSIDKRVSVFYFWLSIKLARLMKSDNDTNVEDNLLFAAPSEKEQWLKQGDYYFRIRKWKLAMKCYQKAELSNKVQVTKAYMIVEDASKQTRAAAVPYYQKAALAFLIADEELHHLEYIDKALTCLKRGKLYEQSAKLLEKIGKLELAAKEWSKTTNHKEHARILEILGDYSGVIRAHVADKDYKNALHKALQFEKKHVKLDSSVTSQQIASELARVKINEGDEESVRHMMNYISDGTVKADFLKEAGLYEEAVDELLKEKRITEAYRFLKAQNMFKEGEILTQNQDTKETFRLYFVRDEMLVHGICNDPLIFSLLDSYRKNSFARPQAEFLYAKYKNDMKYFRQSIYSYNTLKCIPGKLMVHQERVNQNRNLKLDMMEMLTMSRDAHEVARSVAAYVDKKATRKQRCLVYSIFQLYDIEIEHSHYCISKSCYLFAVQTGLILNSPNNWDIDGMIILEKDMFHSALITMYEEMCKTWLTLPGIQNYATKELEKLQSSRNSQNEMTILETCILLVIKNLVTPDESQSIKKSILSLFSFSISSPSISVDVYNSFVREYFRCAAENLIQKLGATFDDHLLTWQIFMAFGFSIGKLRANLHSKIDQADCLVLNYERPTHIFFWWLHAIQALYRDKHIIKSCRTINMHILSRIHEINSLSQVISISSIVDITSLMSTLLIITVNVGSSYEFIVPICYKNFCTNFNTITQMNDVTQICLLNTTGINLAINQLLYILDYLTGYQKKKHGGVLQQVLSSESSLKDGSGQKCLVLCLVLAVNLYSQNTQSACVEYHSRILMIQKEFQNFRRKNDKIRFLNTAYLCLQSAKSLKDIYDLISQLSSDLSIPAFFPQRNVVFKNLHPNHYPQTTIKRFVIIEDPDEVPAQETTSASTLLPLSVTNSEVNSIESSLDTPFTESSDESLTVTSPKFEIEPLDEDIEEQVEKVIDSDLIDDDRECLVCGEISKNDSKGDVTNEDLKSHIESNRHLRNEKLYNEYKEKRENTYKLYENLCQKLEKNNRLIENQSLKKKAKSVYNKTKKDLESLQQSFEWNKCIELLIQYQRQVTVWLNDVQEVKSIVQETEEDQEDKTLLLPEKANMKWTKSLNNN